MKSLLCSLFVAIALLGKSATIIVTNTNDSGAGSFRQAVADANMGDIIRFDPSLISSGSDTIVFATPVLITKGLFIKGVYNSTDTLFFSGAGVSRMIDINMGSTSTFGNVDMDSLVFINGYSTEGGALKYTSDYNPNARLYIRHCVFRNNSSDKGGAIYSSKTSGSGVGSNYTCNFTLEYSTFKNNSSSYSGSFGGGGAIFVYRYSSTTGYAVGIDLQIMGCNFLNNISAARGGAIYAYTYASAPPSQGVCNIESTHSSFIGNEATHLGGALYVYSWGNTRCEAHSYTSTWASNNTIGSGGACYLESVHNVLFDSDFSTFYGNTAFVDGSALYIKSDDNSDSRIECYGSIIAANNGNINYQNSIYQYGSTVPFSSSCYNLFDFPQSHLQYYQEYFPDANDDFDLTLAQINLAPIALNQNGTYTMIPLEGSVAINAGPGAGGNAQNGPSMGIRDIGAAESAFCDAIPVSVSASYCQGSSYDFYGQILTTVGTYTHTIVTPGQCDSLITLTLSETLPVAPTISVTANPGNTIMIGTQVNINASITNGGTTPVFQWYANGNPIGTDASILTTSTLNNGDEVYCVLTSNHNCVNPSTVQSNTIIFTVHSNNDEPCDAISLDVNSTCVTEYFANHIATETLNVGPHTCASSTSRDIWFTFVAPASGTVHIYTYAGTLIDAVMTVYLGPNCSSLFDVGCVDDDGTNQMPQTLVSGATPGDTYYIRMSSFGLTASGNFGICVVDPGTTPVITSNDSDNILCEGGSLILSSDLSTGNVWSNGETTQSITVSTAGTYFVTVNGLISNEIVVSSSTINSLATNTGLGSLMVVETGATYQWVDCNNGNAAISGANSQIFTPTMDGSYAVIVTKNGCSEISNCVVFDLLSVNELTNISLFSIHPNPTQDNFNINFQTKEFRTIKVYTAQGTLVLQLNTAELSEQIDIDHLSSGVYCVEVEENASKLTKKLIVNK